MRVLILGATGSVGHHLVEQALERKLEVTVLVRSPVNGLLEKCSVLVGDALNARDVDRAVAGQDAVIYCIGRSEHRTPTTLFSETTRVLLDAMERREVRRLICITGIGAGDSQGHGGLLYDRVIYPFFTKRTYLDKDRQEALIRQSDLDWVIVRPASYTDGPKTGALRAATDLAGFSVSKISRADVAAFVLDQLRCDQYLRRTPLIGY